MPERTGEEAEILAVALRDQLRCFGRVVFRWARRPVVVSVADEPPDDGLLARLRGHGPPVEPRAGAAPGSPEALERVRRRRALAFLDARLVEQPSPEEALVETYWWQGPASAIGFRYRLVRGAEGWAIREAVRTRVG